MAWSPPAHQRRDCFGFHHPETTPSSIPTTSRTAPHLKTAELLLAHRQHRHGAPPGTPEPGGVSPLSCRGVSSLYCAYSPKSRKVDFWKIPNHQMIQE